jgi:CRP/FNR family transcriptional regulator
LGEKRGPGVPDKYWFLKQIDLFDELSREEMERVDEISQMRELRRGEIVFMPEDESNSVFLLKKGRVKISKMSEDGKEVTIDIIEPGEMFGELSLVDKGPRETIAETLDDVLLCVISKNDFEKMLQKKPDLAIKVTKLMGLRRRSIESRLEDLAFRDVPGRLARLLIRLAEGHGKVHEGRVTINVKLSQQELANLIGSTRETTNHFLNFFRKEGLIDIKKRKITVLNVDELRERGGLDE